MPAPENTYSRETMALPAGPLETGRLVLRPLTPDDTETMVQMDSDPEVMEFIRDYLVAPEDVAGHRVKVRQEITEGIRFKFFYAVAFKESPEEALGWVILRPTENGKWLEIGYRVAKKAWGQGIAPEASQRLLEIAFDDWNVPEVMAVLDSANLKSARVAKKLGFTLQPDPIEMYDMSLSLWVLKQP